MSEEKKIAEGIFFNKLVHYNPTLFPRGMKRAFLKAMQEYADQFNPKPLTDKKYSERTYTREEMYLLSARVVHEIAKNRGNADWNFSTTPKMIADEYLQSLNKQ